LRGLWSARRWSTSWRLEIVSSDCPDNGLLIGLGMVLWSKVETSMPIISEKKPYASRYNLSRPSYNGLA
jgi:hypothetical protein